MGAGNAGSNGGGRTDAGPKRTTASKYTAPKAIGVDKFGNTIMSSGSVSQINESGKKTYDFGNFQNKKYKEKQSGPLVLKPLEPLFDAGSKKTRTFFTDKVLSSDKAKKNIGYTKEEFANLSAVKQDEVAKKFRTNRNAGLTDAYGNVKPGYSKDTIKVSKPDGTFTTKEVIRRTDGGGGDNQPVIVQKNVGGKTIQTTEAKVEEDKKEATQYDERVTKKKGRSKNILTSKQGVMKTSADYSLGKKSLLGQVV